MTVPAEEGPRSMTETDLEAELSRFTVEFLRNLAVMRGQSEIARLGKERVVKQLAVSGMATASQIRYLRILAERRGMSIMPRMLTTKSKAGAQIDAWKHRSAQSEWH
eukprot:6492552-Amphidinium_carterae.1